MTGHRLVINAPAPVVMSGGGVQIVVVNEGVIGLVHMRQALEVANDDPGPPLTGEALEVGLALLGLIPPSATATISGVPSH
ncbi:MAG: hypothetical protein WCJ64_17170 [Rhodospirillaceae bacterium]